MAKNSGTSASKSRKTHPRPAKSRGAEEPHISRKSGVLEERFASHPGARKSSTPNRGKRTAPATPAKKGR